MLKVGNIFIYGSKWHHAHTVLPSICCGPLTISNQRHSGSRFVLSCVDKNGTYYPTPLSHPRMNTYTNLKRTVFWNTAPCTSVRNLPMFQRCLLPSLSGIDKWGSKPSLKHWPISATLHIATPQKTVIFILQETELSNVQTCTLNVSPQFI
jgi:hypothetical protein